MDCNGDAARDMACVRQSTVREAINWNDKAAKDNQQIRLDISHNLQYMQAIRSNAHEQK
jgi:hypothetical protein